MKRLLLATVLLMAGMPAVARAGTYDVVACGSAGVNNSWTTGTSTLTGPVAPGMFQFRTSCAGGMLVQASATPMQSDYG